ncbi:MAG: SDR family oxidoreductase [Candidatus Buchananbacteria bacterium]|nr:SDR family oxidoreductase [Candidatus Buchananbacteria bacterium]
MDKKSIQQLFDFSGKTVVVTGGAKGIGFGIVQRFIEASANVVISDIDNEVGEKKAKDLGKKCLYVSTDVSDESQVENLVNQTVEKFKTIDVFINNAGIYPNKPVMEMTAEFWQKIQDINLKGVFLCSQKAAEVMIKQGGGVFVNIGSIDSLHPSGIGLAAYDASKHGVWGFTKNFALEMADKNIRVNAIAPGGVATEGVEESTKGGVKAGDLTNAFAQKIPMKRFGNPDEMATVALFLASDAASYMTGSLVVADGGYLLA